MTRDALALERRCASWDECPDSLFDAVAIASSADLDERVSSILAWRNAMLSGRLPEPRPPWPAPWASEPFAREVSSLGLLRWCVDAPSLVDELLVDLVEESERRTARRRLLVAERLAKELAELAALRRRFETARARRSFDRASVEHAVDQSLIAEPWNTPSWRERARLWAEVADAFGALGSMLGLGWDLARSILTHVGFGDLAALRALLERLPELRELIRSLGRLHGASTGVTIDEVLTSVRRFGAGEPVRTPLVHAETRGIDRGGELARMLPSEAALLGHPRLRGLWYARFAERQLATFLVDGTVAGAPTEAEVQERRPKPRMERGPILVLIDTSGSMAGAPEVVAKAIVLETLRVAHQERRRCHLYAWSGPGQVIEHELALVPAGLHRLLDFLGSSFHGGTDVAGPLQRALGKLDEDDWRDADLLLVSDGEWPAARELEAAVRAAKEKRGARLVGVCLGDGRSSFSALCDPWFAAHEWLPVARG